MNHFFIEHKQIRLEAALQKGSPLSSVIVCHPHPLYGGNMDNPVVMTIADAFFKKGITTLRFNFRGTGNSSGTFDHGIGEQEDIKAAMAYLAQTGYHRICLAGYSFGAIINAQVVSKGCDIADHIMISPPAAFMSFEDIETLPHTGLIVTGAMDDIAPPDLIQKHIRRWRISPQYEVIENCDHFYSGCLKKLSSILADYLKGKNTDHEDILI